MSKQRGVASHTPGPWKRVGAARPVWSWARVGKNGEPVDQTQEANAALTDAAPDLLAALQKTVDDYGGLHAPGCIDTPPGYSEPCCFIAAARAALAKAKGDT